MTAHPLAHAVRGATFALALLTAAASASAEVVRLRFDFSGNLGAVGDAAFAPLISAGDSLVGHVELGYDTVANNWDFWGVVEGAYTVGGHTVSGLRFSTAGQSANTTSFLFDGGTGMSYVDAGGTTHQLDGLQLNLALSGFASTLPDILALGAGDVSGGLWGTSWTNFGYGRVVAGFAPSTLAVSVVNAVSEPASVALAGLALCAALGAAGGRRPRSSAC